MKSRITQILIALYFLLTFKMVVDEQWVPVCVSMLFGYIWLIRNWDTDKFGTTVEKLVYRALIFTLVLAAIVAVIKNVWWVLPVIVFIIYTNLDHVR